ncbi:serine/threonine protein kinase [Calothrix sp. NIES-2100]|uniref:serine/threonine-protein kinase n=1 Tax=Calothrix sp. NIES-2100 TaxID=1954172 RepID=UPI000B5E9D7F|nr:serine/threonine protein kinase [Calothrix sp. NIES-2100]
MVWASGQQLQAGKYVIEQVLGQGGFGITYKAHHTMLNTFVVIKTPNESLKYDPEYPKFIKRFREEGQRLEKLSESQHPNIVRVRDLFHEGGTYCLVMDFVQGDSLFNLIQKSGALPTEEAVKYITQIGEALKVVHQAGLVHRDAHPGNIMVQQDGKAVLIDFGIAGETIPKTVSFKVFANPAFAPYEQMRGDRKPSLDIYSLAASLYYAVTGELPEASLNRRLYGMALVSPQEHISSMSDRINQAILTGMELEPENRPQTMQEWLELLADEVVTTWTSGHQLQNGKYTIERDIAQGGFGITYLARDENNRQIVIKTLNERVQRRPDFAKLQQDFLNEAVKLAKCNHPHIVKVKEVFQEKHLWCMAMEYIEGEHLADRVVNRGVLSEVEAVGYIQQIGEALTVVHNSGLLHRDVKPANIIVRAGKPEAVLIDFGIAREFTPNVTKLHTANLSHCFAPIEQYKTVAKRGAYTDVYALAATLYFLVTNRLPHPAITRASGVVLEEPKSINPNISIRVNQAILKGIELEAENRSQTMQEWLDLLSVPKPPPPPPPPPLLPDDLSSDKNVDYRRLANLLKIGEWKEADKETLAVMLEASGRKNEGWMDIESIKNFPSTDLHTIDQLWVKYSNGKFGFSVQKNILENITAAPSIKENIKFGSQIGWYRDKKGWLSGKNLYFHTSMHQGYLPLAIRLGIPLRGCRLYWEYFVCVSLVFSFSCVQLLFYILVGNMFIYGEFFRNLVGQSFSNFIGVIIIILGLVISLFFVLTFIPYAMYDRNVNRTLQAYEIIYSRLK